MYIVYIPIRVVVVPDCCELSVMNIEPVASLAVAEQVNIKLPALEGVALYEKV